MAVKHVNTEEFENEVLNAQTPVLVDFWASWCNPCKMLSPIVDEVESEVSSFAKVVKVNVDEEPALAAKYGIMSIPTLIAFNNGEITSKSVGLRTKESIVEMLKK